MFGYNPSQEKRPTNNKELYPGRAPKNSLSYLVSRVHFMPCLRQKFLDDCLGGAEALLKAGTSPDERDPHGLVPLMYVAVGYQLYGGSKFSGRTRATQLLLDYGADPSLQDEYGNTVLELYQHYVGHDHGATKLIETALKEQKAQISRNTVSEEILYSI